MSATFKTIAITGKQSSPDVAVLILNLAKHLARLNFEVVLDHLTSSQLTGHGYRVMTFQEIGEQVDLVIVMGGDGTMLNVARLLVNYNVPLIGVNQGRLGFLTDLSIDSMYETLDAVLDGQYIEESRMLLCARVERNGSNLFSSLAFNDVVLHRGINNGMIEFEVRINDEYVYTLRSDGLIIATPTGSTAYALSAGGPILYPGLDLIELVPICPHTLSNRPIVVAPDASIEVTMRCVQDVHVNCDSHTSFDLKQTDKIMVQRFPKAVTLLHSKQHSYYRMLREKLGWSDFP